MEQGSIRFPAALCAAFLAFTHGAAAVTWYVATNGSDSAAGTNWATAKATIQAAIDAAASSDTVLVSNGVYATGGRVVSGAMTNRVAITNAVTVQSLNGPAATAIRGGGLSGNAVRCGYVGTNAILSGFTLDFGYTRTAGDLRTEQSGAGVWCEASGSLSNCVLTSNWANWSGGGTYGGTLHNCTLFFNHAALGAGADESDLHNCALIGNWASSDGGGAHNSELHNCELSGNSARAGGGAYDSILRGCALAGNSAAGSGGAAAYGALYGCTLTGNSASWGGGGMFGARSTTASRTSTQLAGARITMIPHFNTVAPRRILAGLTTSRTIRNWPAPSTCPPTRRASARAAARTRRVQT